MTAARASVSASVIISVPSWLFGFWDVLVRQESVCVRSRAVTNQKTKYAGKNKRSSAIRDFRTTFIDAYLPTVSQLGKASHHFGLPRIPV